MPSDIRIERHHEAHECHLVVFNHFYNSVHEAHEVVEILVPRARVDGVLWTSKQTAQARRDGRMCRCGKCMACGVWMQLLRERA